MGASWSAPGSSSSSSGGQDGTQPSSSRRGSMERSGSAALGPFSFDEFGQLHQLFTSLCGGGGKHVDPAKFKRHFALEGADWFPERLLGFFLECQRQVSVGSKGGMLTLEGFREGVASSCRSSRAGMVQALFDICNDGGGADMDETQLGRLFEVAYLCSVTAWRPLPHEEGDNDTTSVAAAAANATAEGDEAAAAAATTTTATASRAGGGGGGGGSGGGLGGKFRVQKLARSVASHLESEGGRGPAPGGIGGGGGGVGGGGGGGGGGIRVSSQGLKLWVAERGALLHHCLSTFMHTRCFLYGDAKAKGVKALPCSAASLPRSLAVFSLPRPQQPSFLLETYPAELFGLALSTKALQGPWMRIYNSEEDGMSFNRIVFKLVGYGGPTVILIRERESGAVWGACADSPWKESNSFYGGEGSFLMRLDPDFKVIPSKIASDGHFQYLNLKGFSLPHGIGMGGSTDAFRFFLPEALDGTCVGRSACLTFERGELCPHSSRNFEVDVLEVWGVGGEEALGEALEAREKQRKLTADQINQARQVDKSKFATNAFDKEFLLGKTFGGGGHYNANEDRRQGQS